MISLTSSIWLWAIAGIMIPVLIHLWNIRKGKTLKIGSVSFFSETPVSRARSIRISDLLLLAVRCLLFIMLAILIARPLLMSRLSPGEKGWLLMEKKNMSKVYQQYGQEIDSLMRQGYELHELASEFRSMKISDSSTSGNDAGSYWSLLQQLQRKIPAGLAVHVYTDDKLKRFEGERPSLALNLQWKMVPTNDLSSWIESVYWSYDDSIVVVKGLSTRKGTSFQQMVLAASDPSISKAPLRVDSLLVDTSTLRIGIYADAGTPDARYLASAIEAAKEYSKRKINIEFIRDANSIKGKDWLFWLSRDKIPGQVGSKNQFSYAGGRELKTRTEFDKGNGDLIPVYRLFSDSSSKEIGKRWRTGHGELILQQIQNKWIFYSRFHPGWNDWVWNEGFPQFVLDLLYPWGHSRGIDNRTIDAQQLLPLLKVNQKTRAGMVSKDISHWFWLLALGLFLFERVLVYQKQKNQHG